MKKPLTESEIATLARQLAQSYRTVECLEQLRQWGDEADSKIIALRKRADTSGGGHVDYYLREAQVCAYCRSLETEPIYPDAVAVVFYGLAMARLEQRKRERDYPAYWDGVKAKRT